MDRTVPPHVPTHLVRDFNYRDQPEGRHDPHGAWKTLHDGPDIFWSPYFGGHWVLTRGSDLKAALLDPELFSSTQVSIPPHAQSFPSAPIQFDPPDHTRLKAMGIPAFGPQAVGRIAPEIRRLADELVSSMVDRGSCEFVSDYALRLPIETFMNMAGLPLDDRPMLLDWMETKLRSPDVAERDKATIALGDYARDILEARIRRPGPDLISDLCAAAPDGRKATHDELLGYVTLLMAAGLDTVSSGMGFMMRFLAENPGHRHQLIDDPGLIPNAVEELLRRFGVSAPARVLTRDTVFNGVEMRKGDPVLLPVTLAGLDERMFPDPLEVDFHNRGVAQSLVFGTGIHRCIGSFLARVELRVTLEVWLSRVGDFEIDQNDPPIGVAGLVNTLIHLPLRWTPPAVSSVKAA